jgi:hypothetical protein
MPPTIKETYSLPKRSPVAVRLWIVPGIITVVAFGLWLALPRTPVVAGLLVLIVIAALGSTVARILTSRQFTDLPERQPAKPPSVGGD